jgi:hypothetical protein
MLGSMLAAGSSLKEIGQSIGLFFLDTLASLAIQVGELAIGVGIAVSGIKKALESLNPIVAIAAGVALVALGAYAKTKLSEAAQPTPFADGGIVSSPTNALIGEYAGARSNPEIVAPLDKLTAIIANSLSSIGLGQSSIYTPAMPLLSANELSGNDRTQSIQVEVIGRIDGKDIYLANKRHATNINRTT